MFKKFYFLLLIGTGGKVSPEVNLMLCGFYLLGIFRMCFALSYLITLIYSGGAFLILAMRF